MGIHGVMEELKKHALVGLSIGKMGFNRFNHQKCVGSSGIYWEYHGDNPEGIPHVQTNAYHLCVWLFQYQLEV